MQLDFNVILGQMIFFAVLLLIGYVAAKAKVLTQTALDALSKYVVTIAMPAILITVLPSSCNRDLLLSLWPFFLASFFMFGLLYGIGFLTSKALRLKGTTKNIHIAQTTFGNTTFMGIPLVSSLFGNIGLTYLSIFYIADQIVLWTLGVFLTDNTEEKAGIKLKNLVNIRTIALVIGIIFVLLNYNPQNIVMTTLKGVGDTTKYISMIYLGGVLTTIDFKKSFRTLSLYAIVVTKMIAAPLAVAALLNVLGFLSHQEIIILAFITCLPSMVLISILARNGGSDYAYASESVLVTTLSCMLTIPLVAYLLGFIVV